MAEYSFLEISYDPSIIPTGVVKSNLSKIGFIHRTQHKSGLTGFWNLHKCIILLREEVNSGKSAHISGIGFNSTSLTIESTGATYDSTTDFYVADNSNGIKTYLLSEEQTHHFNSNLAESYVSVDSDSATLKHLDYISGIKLNGHEVDTIEHYIKLGFKYKDVSENYGKLICENNRFTIMLDKRKGTNEISTIISDTHDVFDATAYFLSVGMEPELFNHNVHENFGTKLNYKIRAYNCRAWGNEQSYTIENFIKVTPDIDIIFRQRNQYLHIQESTLDSYYESEH